MKPRRKNGNLKAILIASGAILAFILLLLSLRDNFYISEYVFTRGISRAYVTAIGTVNGIFPFSVLELCAVALIVFIVAAIALFIYRLIRKRKNAVRPLAVLLLTVLCICAVYTVSASFSYYRDPLENNLPLYEGTLSDEEAVAVVNACLDDFNALSEKFTRDENGRLIQPYTNEELSELCKKEYERLAGDDYFTKFTAELKPLTFSDLSSAFGVLGISFQPTGEANYNVNTDPTDMAHVMLHELAHSKGVMYESDAELLATYLGLTSDNDYMRYSAYHNCFSQIKRILSLHGLDEEYVAVTKKLNETIVTELRIAIASYDARESFITDIATTINDIYLKLSGAENGAGSYYVPGEVDIGVTPDGDTVRTITYSPVQRAAIAVIRQKSLQE